MAVRSPGLHFECVLVGEKAGFTALCLDLDVASQGRTAAQAKAKLREAVELYLESAIADNRPYLRPVPNDKAPTKPAIVETFTLQAGVRVRA